MKKVALMAALLAPTFVFADGFNGPYVGGALDYSSMKDKGTAYDQATRQKNGWTQETRPKGFGLGVLGGYNWTSGRAVVGVEADYDLRHGSNSSYQKLNGVTDTDYAGKTRMHAAASLRARVGYLFSNQSQVFATAGYTTAKARRTYNDYTFPPEKESHSSWHGGWTAGFGVESLMSRNVAMRLEYRYANYGRDKVKADLWTEYYKHPLTENSVRLGASYQF